MLIENAYFNNVVYNKFDFEPQKLVYEVSEFKDFVYVTPEQLDYDLSPGVFQKANALCKEGYKRYARAFK